MAIDGNAKMRKHSNPLRFLRLFVAIPATTALTRRRRRPIMGRLFDMSEEQGNCAKP